MLVSVVRTLRPRQWVKNLFVLAPLVFSKHLFDVDLAGRAGIAALAFCALSGAVYAFNDVRDAKDDRNHPIKRHRPIAAGKLGEKTALVLAAVLAVCALAAAFAVAPGVAIAAAGYLAINLAYSLYLKRLAFVDVTLIAAGFIVRVVAGAVAIGVEASPWLLACTALLSAMMGFGKRAHELGQMGSGTTRAALAGYRLGALRWVLLVLAVATTAAYALYTQDSRTVAFFGTRRLLFTLPFCVLGIARFLQLAIFRPRQASPTDAILRDGLFLSNMVVWTAAVLAIIYWL